LTTVVDMEDPRLLPPGDMPARLARMAAETGQPVPTTPAEYTRCILDSLALDYRRIIRQAQGLAGVAVEVVHVVGGGCHNRLLNQMTAEATGLPVVAGPSEATALGNLAVQARAVGALPGSLMDLRQVVRSSSHLDTYHPGALPLRPAAWDAAEARLFPG
jgi:rhamnulokinase